MESYCAYWVLCFARLHLWREHVLTVGALPAFVATYSSSGRVDIAIHTPPLSLRCRLLLGYRQSLGSLG